MKERNDDEERRRAEKNLRKKILLDIQLIYDVKASFSMEYFFDKK